MILIPVPKSLTHRNGSFTLNGRTRIVLDAACDYKDFDAAVGLQQEIRARSGFCIAISKGSCPAGISNAILLKPRLNDDRQVSYMLVVSGDGIEISGAGSEGLFYGVQTLRQLIRNNPGTIPCLEIYDSPLFNNRGFYHDITRGKIPTLGTLKDLADRLSLYKINQLQLYVEHSFAFSRHSGIWIDSDALAAEEILELDEYCKNLNIELVPSLSTFGHLYQALISESYRRLNEYDDLPDLPYSWVDRQAHYTLDVLNPESLKFVFEMIDEFMPLFTSEKFNICCDETFDLGEGRNKEAAVRLGKGKLYVDFVKSIISHVRSNGKTVMMWGDILLKHPEAIKEIPRDAIILNWDYNTQPSEENVRVVADSGLKQYVCAGVHGWNRLMNNIDTACKNIRSLVSLGEKYKAEGVLNTDWGDFGHINLFSNSIPGAIYGAGLSWSPSAAGEPSDEAISMLEYGDRTGKLVGLLREVSKRSIMEWGITVLWYYNVTGIDISICGYEDNYLPIIRDCSEDDARSAYTGIRQLESEIAGLYSSVYSERKADLDEFMISASGLALLQALLLVIKRDFLKQDIKELVFEPALLAEQIEYWFESYKRAWRARNKESELFRIKDAVMGICSLIRRQGDGSRLQH